MLSVGIVGLPNVGKSSLFNALTQGQAEVSNYPFTTIGAHAGVVAVPDRRLVALADRLEPESTTPALLQLIDVAGLVEGASRGEGLGNRFLGEIRQVDAIAHVLRVFPDPEVAHVFGEVDPVRDAAVIETELQLADLELLERAIGRREKLWSTDPRRHADEKERLLRYRRSLESGVPLRSLDLAPAERTELRGLGLLTGRSSLYVANVSEDDLGDEGPTVLSLRRHAAGQATAGVVVVSAKLEAELHELDEEDRAELMAELGLAKSGLERIVEAAFELLGLVRFYTVAHGRLQAWAIPRGTRAPQAAARVHSDMEAGFIRARVAGAGELLEHGGFQELHRIGRLRTEGKDYEVGDGDVIEFLFRAPG